MGFFDGVKVCFRLVKKIAKNPWTQFGLFLGLVGLLVALVSEFGIVAVLGNAFAQVLRYKEKCVSKYFLTIFNDFKLTQIMKKLVWFIVSTGLGSLVNGVKQSVEKFMNGDEDFVDKLE